MSSKCESARDDCGPAECKVLDVKIKPSRDDAKDHQGGGLIVRCDSGESVIAKMGKRPTTNHTRSGQNGLSPERKQNCEKLETNKCDESTSKGTKSQI